MLEGPAEPVEFGDDELVAVPSGAKGVVQVGAAGEFAAGFVDEYRLAAGCAKGVVLSLGVLVSGRDAPVSDLHSQNVT